MPKTDLAKDFGDFIDGQRDCKAGRPHRAGRSEHYDRGYSAQYTLEQILTEQASHDSNDRNPA